MYINIHVNTHTHTHTHINIYMYICIHTHIYVYMYTECTPSSEDKTPWDVSQTAFVKARATFGMGACKEFVSHMLDRQGELTAIVTVGTYLTWRQAKQLQVIRLAGSQVDSSCESEWTYLTWGQIRRPQITNLTGSRSSFNDVALRDCQNCRTRRHYRDAQDRLLWRDKTCPART